MAFSCDGRGAEAVDGRLTEGTRYWREMAYAEQYRADRIREKVWRLEEQARLAAARIAELKQELEDSRNVVLSYRPKPPAAKPRKKKSTGWQGAICSTCFRPVVGVGDDWRHLDGRMAHKVVVRQLSR